MANFQLGDTEQAPFALTELDADSNPATPRADDTITVTSSDTDSVSVVIDATPATGSVVSGNIVGGAKLATGVTITATVTHADGTALTTSNLVDVVGGQASSIALGFGTPVLQGQPTTPPLGPVATASARRPK